jgi:ribose 1,5-bisphosphokinase
MAGRLFAVVGPSGAGKDTLMAAAQAHRPDLVMVRRVITRAPDAGGEDFDAVTEAEFLNRRDAGAFALWWQAHGLYYGIPASIDDALAEGRDVVFNGSRGVLSEASEKYPGLVVLLITASDAVLAERLAARGRESAADIAARLKRAAFALPAGLNIREIRNDGALEDAVQAVLDVCQPESA